MLERRPLFPHVIEINHAAGQRLGCCVYLIYDGEDWALIDIGFDESVEEIVEIIRQLDFPLSKCETLIATHERPPAHFEELLGTSGVGPKTIRALGLVADLIYSAKVSFRDPAAYSFAHGGKDGHPYPVDRSRYDTTIETLRRAVDGARVDRTDKTKALKRLSSWYRSRAERCGDSS